MAAIFGVDTSAIKADWGIDLFVRIVSNKFIARKFGPRINLDCGIGDLDKSLAIAHGYLQTKCHVKNFSEKSIAELFQIPENLYSDSPAIALHIRATDGLEREDMRLGHEYYERALNYFTNGETTLVDVYTDDISYAKKFCAQIGKHNFNFPEELKSLEPIELLRALGGYNRIVSSKSTLCWWACFIAKLGKSKVEVVSPWEAAMELENWFPLK
jgi:hypothetical protein